jgi:hypothetical protein
MSAAEFQQWWLYYQCEPWGEWRGDFQAGLLASTMVQLWSDSRGKRLRPQDFMPDFWPVTPPRAATTGVTRQSPQHMLAVLMRGTQAAGGTIDPRLRALLDEEAA